MSEFTKIEERLKQYGWVEQGRCPLIVNMDLRSFVTWERVNKKGERTELKALYLSQKGERFVRHQSIREQLVVEGRINLADNSYTSFLQEHSFDPNSVAVSAGFGDVITVNLPNCQVRFWKMPEKKE